MGVLGIPSPGNITKYFRAVSPAHYGTDRGWGNGTDVYAMADGTVIQVAKLTDYGKVIRIAHGRLIGGKTTVTRYAHLSRQVVEVGDTVKRGEKIGVQGNTGSLLAPYFYVHLHSELWLDGLRYDERPYQAGSTITDLDTAPIPVPLPIEEGNKDMLILKPTTSGTTFPSPPVARILTDMRYKEIVTDPARIAALDFTSSRTDGPPTLIFDKVNWDAYAALPNFPSSLGGGGMADAEVVDDAEMQSLLTATANAINGHTTDAKVEILNAIASASGLTGLTITLTGTATPE